MKSAISINVEELNKQSHKYLKQEYWPDITNDDLQKIATQLTDHKKQKNHYNIAPSISPNGNEIAIFSDRHGIQLLCYVFRVTNHGNFSLMNQ